MMPLPKNDDDNDVKLVTVERWWNFIILKSVSMRTILHINLVRSLNLCRCPTTGRFKKLGTLINNKISFCPNLAK